MRSIAADITRSVVCVLLTLIYCAKTGEPIKMPLGSLIHVGPKNPVLDVGQNWTNPLTAIRGEKSAMQPFAK